MTNSYDQLIYSGLPRPESHPLHLSSIAKLFGVNSKDLSSSRVLELGCGTGSNLIPLAERWPESVFLGIDLSGKQIDLGKKIIQELNLKNIELRQESILDFSKNSGQFDYIICHGVFSWVNKTIQDKILNIFSKHLTIDGLGYLSYNALPGWRAKGAIREMMQYHTTDIADPQEKALQAKALIKFLSESQSDPQNPYGQILQNCFKELQSAPAHYLFHEYLEQENQAFYFHEVISRLESAGLAYVADSQFALMTTVDLPQDTQNLLEGLSNRAKLEQYLDFIRNRKLRESIICRHPKKIVYPALKSDLSNFYLSAEFVSEEELGLEKDKVTAFRTSQGGEIKTNNPLTVEALRILHNSWPRQIKVNSLISEAASILNLRIESAEGEIQRLNFEEEIFLFYSANLVELELYCYNATADYRNLPKVSAIARYQSLRQERITSLRHKAVQLESIVRQILFLLDGSRDKPAIIDELNRLCSKGELAIEIADKELSNIEMQEFLATIVERSLKLLSRHSFLVNSLSSN